MTRKRADDWTPGMTGRDEQGRQVKCLVADNGHIWMPDYDRLPSVVRRRLAESRHNICAACMAIEAGAIAQRGGRTDVSVKIYLEVIDAIERQLDPQGVSQ
jgi:hypothetical protein